MNKQEKAQFIRSCLRGTEVALLKKLDAVPETWDGHELRAWIVLDVGRHIGMGLVPVELLLRDRRRPRVKAFECDVIKHDLL